MTDFSDLVVARSQVVIRTNIYTDLAAEEVTIEGLQEESLLRALPEVFSRLVFALEADRVNLTYAGFPSGWVQLTSAPAWGELGAEDFFQVIRDPALPTLGKMRITASTGASSSTIQPGDLVVRYGAGSAQKLYVNTEGFAPVPGSYVDVAMTAQEAGAAGNIGNGATLYLVTAYPGLSVTNPAITGTQSWITRRGKDAETLVSLKQRCDEKWADLSLEVSSQRFARIIRDAFEAAGETNPITRIYVDDTNPDGPGSVWVYMAREGSTATAEDVALVDAYVVPRWRTGGGPFKSYAASTLTITVSGTIKGPANSDSALEQASAALQALAPTYAIGEAVVYLEQIRTALMTGVSGAVNVVLSAPIADTSIPAGSIVAFSIGSITVEP
ncbi:MAG: hypothetical protein EKK62_03195 [Acidimicrobiia bacterium]|nr:MAG: hypothetical protein EKK62_03195 [Acidimicrobiia bacterium]